MADTFSRRHNVTPEASGIKCNREPRVLMWMCHINLGSWRSMFCSWQQATGTGEGRQVLPWSFQSSMSKSII